MFSDSDPNPNSEDRSEYDITEESSIPPPEEEGEKFQVSDHYVYGSKEEEERLEQQAKEAKEEEDDVDRNKRRQAQAQDTLEQKITGTWEHFLRSFQVRKKKTNYDQGVEVYKYYDKIRQMRTEGTATLEVDFGDLIWQIDRVEGEEENDYKTIKSIALSDLEKTEKCLREAVSAILLEVSPDYLDEIRGLKEKDRKIKIDRLNVGITNYEVTKELPDIDSLDVGLTRRVEGIIIQYDTDKQLRVLESVWICSYGHQSSMPGAVKPKKCSTLDCDGMVLNELIDRQKVVDFMYIRLQQRPESMSETRVDPYELDIYFEGNEKVKKVLSVVQPGLPVAINGTVLPTETAKGSRDFRGIEIQGSTIEVMSEAHMMKQDVVLDNYVRREIPLEHIPAHFKKLCKGIASHLEGLDLVKTAILLQAVGTGATIIQTDDSRARGDSNILIVASPEKGKTELLRFASRLRPRSEYQVATNATAVGLTAGVQTVEVLRGGVKLTSKRVFFGAYSRCNNALLALDEVMKGKDYYDSLLSPMETQEIPLTKFGVNKTLSTKVASLHATNPTTNRGIYNPMIPFWDQIDLGGPLLTRYDLIFVLKDDDSEGAQTRLWDQLEKSYDTAVSEKEYELIKKSRETALEETDIKGDHYSEAYLKREIIFLRENYHPRIKKNSIAWKMMKEFWLEYHKMNLLPYDQEDKLTEAMGLHMPAVGIRKISTLIRLAESSARAHRRNEVLQDDMDIAISLVKYCLAMLIPNRINVRAIMAASKSGRDMEKKGSVEHDRDKRARQNEWKNVFFKFLKIIREMTFHACKAEDGCKGRGTVIISGKVVPCGHCQGQKGQYRKFTHVELRRWMHGTETIPSEKVDELLQTALKNEIVQPAGGGKMLVTVDLHDPAFVKSLKSEIFSPELESDKEAKKQAEEDIAFLTADKMSDLAD